MGLDISTSIVGVSVVNNDGVVLSCEFLDIRNKNKFPDLYSKASHIKDRLWEIDDKFHIDTVFIEKPFMFFNSGGSTAKTMSILQSFNGMVSWICKEVFNKNPEHITVSEARKSVGIKVKRGENSKEKVLQYVVDNYHQIVIEYTKHGNPRPGTYDMCDSLIIALAGYNICTKNFLS